MPKGKGKKFATSCIRSNPDQKAVRECSKKVEVSLVVNCWTYMLKRVPRDQMVGVGLFLWMGTVRQLRSPPWILDGATVLMTAKVATNSKAIGTSSKLIQLGGGQWSKGFLQIANLDLLRGVDCLTMRRSNRVIQSPGDSEGNQRHKGAGPWQTGGLGWHFQFSPF